mmetsp:Transcript_19563/g.50082  ORF Transcript_19563/g.50082 Transcript_19563/m.50082 type:complete len:263 (-) Transcript_19563:181-969(-)
MMAHGGAPATYNRAHAFTGKLVRARKDTLQQVAWPHGSVRTDDSEASSMWTCQALVCTPTLWRCPQVGTTNRGEQTTCNRGRLSCGQPIRLFALRITPGHAAPSGLGQWRRLCQLQWGPCRWRQETKKPAGPTAQCRSRGPGLAAPHVRRRDCWLRSRRRRIPTCRLGRRPLGPIRRRRRRSTTATWSNPHLHHHGCCRRSSPKLTAGRARQPSAASQARSSRPAPRGQRANVWQRKARRRSAGRRRTVPPGAARRCPRHLC